MILSFDKSGKSTYKAQSTGGFAFIVERDSEAGGYILCAEGITTYYTDARAFTEKQDTTPKAWIVLKEVQRVAQSIEDTLYPRDGGISIRKQNTEAHLMVSEIIKKGYGPQKVVFIPAPGNTVILVESGHAVEVVEVITHPKGDRYKVKTPTGAEMSQPITKLLPDTSEYVGLTRDKRREVAKTLHCEE